MQDVAAGPDDGGHTTRPHPSSGSPAPVATIVIPNRNYGHFAVHAVESVLHQTRHDVECIVVDYGSTDDSIARLSRYPIRLLTSPGPSLAAAFQHGLEQARGRLVAMLGADDVLHPAFVERSVQALARDPGAAWAYTGGYLFGPGAPAPGGRRILAPPFSRRRLRRENYILATALTRKEVLEELGTYGDDVGFEDWDLWLRLSEAGHRGVPVDEPLLHYRQHSPTQRNNVPRRTFEQSRDQVLQRNLGRPLRQGPLARLVRGARWRRDQVLGRWIAAQPSRAHAALRLPGVTRLKAFWWIPVTAEQAEPRHDFLHPGHTCAQEGLARRA